VTTTLLLGSAVLPGVSALGNWMISHRWTTGWLLITVIQIGWAVFGAATGQWGFTAWSVVFFTINLRAWIRWRRHDNALHAMA
jgi:hypothetical protein